MPVLRGPGQPRIARGELLAALGVTLLAVVCFAGAVSGPFILDDWPLIANNSRVHSLGEWREWLTGDFWNVDVAQAQLGERLRYFRPLVLASYAFDWQLSSGSVSWLHATNLLLHGLVALLAFYTLRRWTQDLPSATLAAVIFSVHPSKAESVAWISGRPDLWLTLGVLLASLGVARRLRREPGAHALEVLGTTIAYLSKEHAIVLPLFACVECWVVLGRPGLNRAALRQMALAAWPQLSLALLYLGVRTWLMPLRQFELSGLSSLTHAGFVFETLGRIHALALWPADLTTLQGMIRTSPEGPRLDSFYVTLGALCTTLSLLLAVLCRRRRPVLSISLALWLAALLPVSNVVWSGLPNLTSPRFLYLPLLGLAWALAELTRSRLEQRALWLAAIAVTLALSARAFVRTSDFRSVTAFWNRELSEHPDLAVGYLFAVDHAKNQGRPRQALELAAHGFAITARDYSHAAQRSTLILKAVQLASSLTRDAAASELLAIDRFISELMGTELATLKLAEIGLEIPPNALVRRQLAPRYPELLLVQAEIAVRLGADGRALRLAEQAVSKCPRCSAEWESAGRIAVRAGDHARAHVWLAGPRQRDWSELPAALRSWADAARSLDHELAAAGGVRKAQLEVQRYLLLALPGRAYAVLAAHETELGTSPAARRVLAEAAARAGAVDKARAALAEAPAAEIERLLAEWTAIGAQDTPLDPHDDLEFEATLRRLLTTS